MPVCRAHALIDQNNIRQDQSLAVTSTIETGRYHWVVNVVNGNSYFNLIPTNSLRLDKFHAAVKVQFVQGNDDGQSAYGLTFRHVDNDYGFFGILKSGRFLALEVHHTGIYQSLGGRSLAIDTRPGHTNRLEVVGIGSDYVFLINGQQVAQMTADIDPGHIGLGVDAVEVPWLKSFPIKARGLRISAKSPHDCGMVWGIWPCASIILVRLPYQGWRPKM